MPSEASKTPSAANSLMPPSSDGGVGALVSPRSSSKVPTSPRGGVNMNRNASMIKSRSTVGVPSARGTGSSISDHQYFAELMEMKEELGKVKTQNKELLRMMQQIYFSSFAKEVAQ